MQNFPIGLSIAGFDGSGGAGMQADMKVFSALGVYASTVLTSLPIQNTCGVQKVYDLPLEAIEDQLDCIFSDLEISVVKIGMLHKTSIIDLVSRKLVEFNPDYIVADPVMVAKSGHRLLEEDAIQALKEKILPIANILTPNIPEAEDLLGYKHDPEDYKNSIENMAKEIWKIGEKSPLSLTRKHPRAVVIKGGHSGREESEDCFLLNGTEYYWDSGPRTDSKNTHGTGCTFSCAMASELAKGCSFPDAFFNARKYIKEAIKASKDHKIGKGKGPVHFFFHQW